MLRRFRPLLTCLTTTLLLACDAAPEFAGDDLEEVEPRDGPGQGGPVFNTPNLANYSVHTIDVLGKRLHGTKLLDVEILGVGGYESIDPFTLRGYEGALKAIVLGDVVHGLDFIDSRWTFDVDGDIVTAYITDIESSAAAGLYNPAIPSSLRKLDPDRLVYDFAWEDDVKALHDVCATDTTGGSRMVIYDDITVDHTTGDILQRSNSLYLGCLAGAVGKAALWGYAPDSPSLPSVTLAAFETATRVVRDDFCADGTPHTLVGKPVLLRDRWGINTSFPSLPAFTTEAVWFAGGGAKCIKRIRETGATVTSPYLCPDGHVIPVCVGDTFLENAYVNHNYGDIWTKSF